MPQHFVTERECPSRCWLLCRWIGGISLLHLFSWDFWTYASYGLAEQRYLVAAAYGLAIPVEVTVLATSMVRNYARTGDAWMALRRSSVTLCWVIAASLALQVTGLFIGVWSPLF
jgi:hypothetical protein